jgi:hypothetical protein
MSKRTCAKLTLKSVTCQGEFANRNMEKGKRKFDRPSAIGYRPRSAAALSPRQSAIFRFPFSNFRLRTTKKRPRTSSMEDVGVFHDVSTVVYRAQRRESRGPVGTPHEVPLFIRAQRTGSRGPVGTLCVRKDGVYPRTAERSEGIPAGCLTRLRSSLPPRQTVPRFGEAREARTSSPHLSHPRTGRACAEGCSGERCMFEDRSRFEPRR